MENILYISKKVRKTISKKNVSNALWGLLLLSYFFQFPFKNLSHLIIPSLFLFIIINIDKLRINSNFCRFFIILLLYLFFSSVYSLHLGTEFSRIIRFLLILVFIPICTLIKFDDFDSYYKTFIKFSFIKSIVIITIALYLVYTQNHDYIRNWVTMNGLGDIYLLGPLSPKVQVHGNALLVMAFIISYMKDKGFSKVNIILLLGVLFAGNFAYYLGVALFFVCKGVLLGYKWLKQKNKKIVILLITFIIGIIISIPYIQSTIKLKSEFSNAVRFEQAEMLLDTNALIGNGIGHSISKTTEFRKYDGDIYFELQTLYIYNQLGIIGIILFYITVLSQFFDKKGKLIIYLIYLFYTFWNPYCFDTTQMIVTIIVMNCDFIERIFNNDKSINNNIQPN